MQYRIMDGLEWKPSALGFGCMRLPIIGDDHNRIDEPQAIEMIRYAINNGVNYVDTAYGYHGGNSEVVVGKALKDGYRDKVMLATKLPTWLVNTYEDMDRLLNEQLTRLDTDHIDFYLLHSLSQDHWKQITKVDVFGWLDKVHAEGKIRYMGFSFHDNYDLFEEIINAYDHWTFCQIQYNYMDEDFQAGKKGLQYAASKGLGVVVMEPLRGGRLVNNLPPQIIDILNSAPTKRSLADWALQWVWNQPEVSIVLSGMSNMEQVKQNIESANRSGVNTLTQEELDILTKAKETYRKLSPIPCTGCYYCMPCPSGVNIPGNFELYNNAHIYNDFERFQKAYMHMNEADRASACEACGTCEGVCPQGIEITDRMAEVKEYFER
ncbi:aldo/keto reductase [Mahella australiensis]|uniref:Aldo/keto reductase n=1 Tax=Mahella australiensis (strain DSM 15567 / CIP 107919 / 50-1 BON) TaxID=697281 RepID=F3ZYR9_MAHA5|nr:aldo/keto reductase [Mahella australiensis]AEE95664.1 aldo/keto reductase [Mahella australiensis 50-1 BON]